MGILLYKLINSAEIGESQKIIAIWVQVDLPHDVQVVIQLLNQIVKIHIHLRKELLIILLTMVGPLFLT